MSSGPRHGPSSRRGRPRRRRSGSIALGAALALLAPGVLPAAAAPAKPAWKDHDLGLLVLSAGTWTSYGRLQGFSRSDFKSPIERHEFNKPLSVALYGTCFGLPAYLGLPLQWTAVRQAGADVHRLAPGDLETYLGKRLGRVEGRLGLILPAGYDRGIEYTRPGDRGRPGNPWIGPGNVQVTVGAAANPNLTRYSGRWEASGEAKWALALDDGIAKAGTWGLYPSAKVSFRPVEAWKPGVELSGYWKSQHWGRSVAIREAFGGDADWSAGAVATLFLETYRSRALAVGAKAGHSLWGYQGDASYNATLYLLWFPK